MHYQLNEYPRFDYVTITKHTDNGVEEIAFLQGDEANELCNEIERVAALPHATPELVESVLEDYDY